jgi:Asp-tRNA(Asn)/Glu-tRNA(Gln) amidotransferase A subunit family amidase
VAAGLCPVATGTQTVGSVGRPAAFCGVVGLMPTAARIPTEGIFPVSWSLDHVGGFAGSVGDVRLFAESMCGVRFRIPKRPDPPRIGVVGEFFETHTARGAWERHTDLVRKLEEQAVVVKLRLPEVFGVALPAHWTIMRSELGAVHERLHERHAAVYGDRLRGFVESGMLVPARDYIRALRVRRLFQRRMRDLFSSCDVVLTPGATGPAPRGLETTGDPVLSAPWTLADCPTLSMPLCLHDGLPLGIQLTAPPMEEARLLAAGLWLERRIAFRDRPTVRSAM